MELKEGDLVKVRGLLNDLVCVVLTAGGKATEILEPDGTRRWISSVFITKINNE